MPPTVRRNLFLMYLALALVGCVGAQDVPPQLAATAAPSYSITEAGLNTDRYSIVPPLGWRVIAGPAEDPYTFQFVQPEDTALMVVSDRPLTAESLPRPAGLADVPDGEVVAGTQAVSRDGQPDIYVGYIGRAGESALLEAIFLQTVATLR
ncbi:MAG: hypothetical protein MUF38_07830 [Anaerolineae bacterium]|nr:hypothetical protein [Anaerolineae bacterium]